MMDGIYAHCLYCGKTIKNGRFLGTIHLCLTAEERAIKDAAFNQFYYMQAAQQNIKPIDLTKYLAAPPGLDKDG